MVGAFFCAADHTGESESEANYSGKYSETDRRVSAASTRDGAVKRGVGAAVQVLLVGVSGHELVCSFRDAGRDEHPTPGWFGPVGFVTVVVMFPVLFVVVSVVGGSDSPGWPLPALAGMVFGAILSVPRGVVRQIGVALVVAISAVAVPYSVYPILAVLLVTVPVVAVCAVAAGIPYLISRRRR
ncbi:hypothetical protein [Nocardia sp. NBC_01329]|uniref:hypothetical protein n=1 Tax=Nocardia sp. NBC_01329 TaxID=2903594 RepID=UPI002E166B97|nr:hypothetical protein OG405_15245 [Nocardia sp. NBC_01329]